MIDKKGMLIKIVGKEHVLDAPDALDAFARDQSFTPPMAPAFIVRPETSREVQAIVQWGNQTRTPLLPVSSGSPRFRGDTVPELPGTVMVDLRRMDRIIRIDRRNRIIIIEPGVTYAQLQPELLKNGLRLSTPLLPRRNKSVIASLLEREPTLVPRFQWAMLDPLRCLELVWGDGQLFTTGEVSKPGALENEWKMNLSQATPMGPAQVDFYKLVSAAQGSMGIVTWASVKCEVAPTHHELLVFPADRLGDLTDFVYSVLRIRFGDEILLLNRADLAGILARNPDEVENLKGVLPPWCALIGIAGRDILPGERVAYQKQDLVQMAQHSGLELLAGIPEMSPDDLLEKILNPLGESCWKQNLKGGCQDIFFLTTLDQTPAFAELVLTEAEKRGYPVSDIGTYIQPVQQGVSCHCEFSFPFDPEAVEAVERVRELTKDISAALLQHGAFFSRPYHIWADLAFGQDPQTSAALKTIKGIFDPNQIMNPGKLCFRNREVAR